MTNESLLRPATNVKGSKPRPVPFGHCNLPLSCSCVKCWERKQRERENPMTDKTEVSDCYMMLPLEFWRLAKINDGRAVLYFTEQQYREVRNALRQYPRFESLSAEVEALKAERDRLRAMVPRWVPIESAPKDGTRVLLSRSADVDEDGEERQGITAAGYWVEECPDYPDEMGHDAGFVDCDYSVFSLPRTFGVEKYRWQGLQPTHWMRYPHPPREINDE